MTHTIKIKFYYVAFYFTVSDFKVLIFFSWYLLLLSLSLLSLVSVFVLFWILTPQLQVLTYSWQKRLPTCVDLFPEQTDTSGRVKLSILHWSSALVFLTIWPDQLCQFVPLCLPPQKDCYKVSPSYFTTIQTFFKIFFSIHFNEMQSFTFIFYYISDLFKIFP